MNLIIVDFPYSFPLWNSKLPIENLVKKFCPKFLFCLPPVKIRDGPPKPRHALVRTIYCTTYIPNNFPNLHWRVAETKHDKAKVLLAPL